MISIELRLPLMNYLEVATDVMQTSLLRHFDRFGLDSSPPQVT